MAVSGHFLVLALILSPLVIEVKAPMPLMPAGISAGNAMVGLSGLADFVSKIKSIVGKPAEFANRNDFEYGHIYNAILQFAVIQAFEQTQTNKIMTKSVDEVEKVNIEIGKLLYVQAATSIVLIINLFVLYKASNAMRADQNVNVVHA